MSKLTWAALAGASLLGMTLGAGAYWLFVAPRAEVPAEVLEPVARPAPATAGVEVAARGAFAFGPPGSDGDDLAELSFYDGSGRRLTLADFRGQALLVNLWATWCAPCREEMPTLDRLQARLGGPDFEVIALSIDRDGDRVIAPFYAELGLEALDIYWDRGGVATVLLNVLGIPTTLLIDENGREVGRFTGPAEWDSEAVVEAIRAALGRGGQG